MTLESQFLGTHLATSAYLEIHSKYNSIKDKVGYFPLRKELYQKHRVFYNRVRDLEKKGMMFDFLPNLKKIKRKK